VRKVPHLPPLGPEAKSAPSLADTAVRPPAGGIALLGRALRRRCRTAGAGNPVPGTAAFTLLEVLVAITVFAMAAIVLGSAYLNVLNTYDLVARESQVGEDFGFARQLVLTEADREKLEEGGEFETADGRRATWSVEILSTGTADLFQVTLNFEISRLDSPEPERRSQTFMVLRPTWSIDQAEHDKLREEARTRIVELQGKQMT
jgi:general secretion pathway protein I